MSAAGRRAVTHCQEHTDVPAAWERHVHRASHVAHKQPGLQSSRLRCLGCPSTDGLLTSTIHDNQPAEAGNRHWVGKTIAAFHRSRHWSVPSPAWGSSRSKANKLNIWCKNCSIWVTLDNNWDNKHFVNFLKICCYRSRLVFNCCLFEDTWHFTR